MTALGGGCQLPLGAIAGDRDGTLEMLAIVASLDGSRSVRRSMSGPSAEPGELGRRLAEALEAEGARELLDEVRGEPGLITATRARQHHEEHDDTMADEENSS